MTIDKKIVLIGAGSASFGPPTLNDLFHSKILPGSTIVLVDIDIEKLTIVYDIVVQENKMREELFNIEMTTDRKKAIKNADFVISSIEHGDRFKFRWQDHKIPHKYGTTEMMGENGGPGGFFHSARQIPEIVKIAKDVYSSNPHAFFINYSNPISRICLAIKRAVPNLKMIGLCHQINLILKDLPYIIDDSFQGVDLPSSEKKLRFQESLSNTKITVGGLNHFAFIIGLENISTGENLMPKFNERIMGYYKDKWDRFCFADLTFEFYKRFGLFPYVGDNHLCEFIQFGSEYTKYQDFTDWIENMEQGKKGMNDKFLRYHKRLKKGNYPKKGVLTTEYTGERVGAIIEEIIEDKNAYEIVNIPNDGIIQNLPHDLIIECSGIVNKEGVHGVKLGNIPKSIATLLRIEASIQDVCVEAILRESKDLAIATIAMDVNCGNFEIADKIYNEMYELQKEYLPKFK